MPAGDGTGPEGRGSMTGRGLGYCGGYGRPGYTSPGPGRGRGLGWGRGRWAGRGYRWFNRPDPAYFDPYIPYVTPDKEQEATYLRNQADALKARLEEIEKRLDSLTGED